MFINVAGLKGSIRQADQSGRAGEHETVIFTVNSVGGGSKPFQTCALLLADSPVTLVVDIGAKVSILGVEKTCQSLSLVRAR